MNPDAFAVVVIDGETAVHGGGDWRGLESCGSVAVYPLSAAAEVYSRLATAHAVITNKVPVDGPLMQRLARLKYIGVTATGFNIIDVESARRRGIAVTNVPAYSTDSVAQHVFALILARYSCVERYAQLVKDGAWSRSPQFCLLDQPMIELRGKTIGIIGYGAIGRQVAEIARAFGMQVLILARKDSVQEGRVTLDLLLSRSDVVTLHCPLTDETRGMVNASFLARMKSASMLINTSRGALVVEADLERALRERVIAHAALDVLDQEPPVADHPLVVNEYATITPHVAWATSEARARLVRETVLNLEAFRRGERRNRVD